MNSLVYAALGTELDALAHRIECDIRRLRDSGRLVVAYQSIALLIRKRQRELRERVDCAIRGGHSWDVVKADIRGDFESLSRNVLQFEHQLESELSEHRWQ